MAKQIIRKFTSLTIIVSLLLSVLPGSQSVMAVDGAATPVEQPDPLVAQNDSLAEDKEIVLSADSVPEIVGYEKALQEKHILRLYDEEGDDLNKVIFLNKDGTRTMYLYDHPVKYMDSSGAVQDVSLDIATAATGFRTASGNVVTTFSADISDGISLTGNGTNIELVPIVPKASLQTGSMTADAVAQPVTQHTAERIDGKTIQYPYDSKTTIEYSLTYTGFKEDIVVSEYTGQTEYAFKLYTHGCALTEIDGSYYLTDEEENIKATVGDIIIFTADERNNTFGQIVPTTVVENELYLLTIVVDADYLADENTAYPIRIDPTLEINYDSNSSGIQDITVCDSTTYSGSHGSLYMGDKEGVGLCRALMKFPGLDFLNSSITVQSATLLMRDLMCEGQMMDIYCHIFSGNEWSESGATWTSTNAGSNSSIGDHLDTVSMSYDTGRALSPRHWYSFDITAAAQAWADGTANLNKGIIFKTPAAIEEGDTDRSRTLGAYNRSENKPSLTVNYTVNIIEVEKNKTMTLSAEGITGTVSWASSDSNIAIVNGSGVVTGVHAGLAEITASVDGVVKKTFPVRVVLKDGVYWITNATYDYFLTADDGSLQDGTPVGLQTAYRTMPNKLLQQWKITYLGDGNYSIRPMHRLNMGLDNSNGDIDIWTIGENDTSYDIPSYAKWEIFYESTGYVIRSCEPDQYAIKRPTSDVNTIQLTGAPYLDSDTTFRWILGTVINPENGIVFYDTNNHNLCTSFAAYLAQGETRTLADFGIIPIVYSPSSNSQALLWETSNSATVGVNVVTGSVTGVLRGKATITAKTYINETIHSAACHLTNEETIYIDNYYDTTVQNNQTVLDSIDNAVEFLNTVYRDDFYLHFVVNGAPQPYADSRFYACEYGCYAACVTGESDMQCGDDCSTHHKNVQRITSMLLIDWEPNHIRVKWGNSPSGTYCEDAGGHTVKEAYAMMMPIERNGIYVPQPAVLILTTIPSEDVNVSDFAAVNLAHEVGHVLGLQEVYRGDYNISDIETHLQYNGNQEYTPCVMAASAISGSSIITDRGKDALCETCRGYLSTAIANDVLTSLD